MTGTPQTTDRIEVLISAEEIAGRISQLADEIVASKPADLLVVPILIGGFVFAADLIRALHAAGLNPEIDVLMLSSYRGGKRSSGRIQVLRDVEAALADRDVLLVDDILDSGRTLAYAKTLMESRRARSVASCVLLDKPVTRAAAVDLDFTGFSCPNTFVVGYGMDLDNRFRELPFIGRIMQDSD